jgi:hypothetical protein
MNCGMDLDLELKAILLMKLTKEKSKCNLGDEIYLTMEKFNIVNND